MPDGPTTPATLALEGAGIPYRAHPYEHDPGADRFAEPGSTKHAADRLRRPKNYGLEAAEVLGVEPERVFKTLLADVDGELVVGIVPVTSRLHLKSLAAAVGGKRASMADPAVAERRTGYLVGGISPIGQKRPHTTVLDETAELFDTVYVSGGRRGFDVELAPADLVRLTGATLADIAR